MVVRAASTAAMISWRSDASAMEQPAHNTACEAIGADLSSKRKRRMGEMLAGIARLYEGVVACAFGAQRGLVSRPCQMRVMITASSVTR